jgi:hypothetical protein
MPPRECLRVPVRATVARERDARNRCDLDGDECCVGCAAVAGHDGSHSCHPLHIPREAGGMDNHRRGQYHLIYQFAWLDAITPLFVETGVSGVRPTSILAARVVSPPVLPAAARRRASAAITHMVQHTVYRQVARRTIRYLPDFPRITHPIPYWPAPIPPLPTPHPLHIPHLPTTLTTKGPNLPSQTDRSSTLPVAASCGLYRVSRAPASPDGRRQSRPISANLGQANTSRCFRRGVRTRMATRLDDCYALSRSSSLLRVGRGARHPYRRAPIRRTKTKTAARPAATEP